MGVHCEKCPDFLIELSVCLCIIMASSDQKRLSTNSGLCRSCVTAAIARSIFLSCIGTVAGAASTQGGPACAHRLIFGCFSCVQEGGGS